MSSPDIFHVLLLSLLAAVLGSLLLNRRRAGRAQLAADEGMATQAARHAAVIDSVPDAVLSVDAEQRIVLFNPAAERLFGCSAQDALGSDLARFIPPGMRERHAALVTAYAQSGTGRDALRMHREVLALRADGRTVPVEASVSQLDVPAPGSPATLFSVVLRDISERKAAQAEVHRIQQRYRSVVEQSPEAIWLAEDGRVVLANLTAVRLVGGRGAAEVVGRRLADFVPALAGAADPAGVADNGAPQAAGAAGAVTFGLSEQRLLRLDGAERDVEMSVAQVPDHGGVALQVVMRDIGERKRLERLRQERESLLGQIVRIAQTVPGVILEWVAQADGRVTVPFASAMFESLFGLPPAAVTDDAAPLVARFHPDDRHGLRLALDRAATELTTCRHEWRFRHPLHGERWLEGRAMPRRDADGAVIWNAFVMDVSERKQAEQAVVEHRSRLLEAERIAKMGHFSLDLDTGEWTLSESACQVLGRRPGGPLPYRRGLDIAHPDDRAGLDLMLQCDVAGSRESLDVECRMQRADNGEYRWVHALGTRQGGLPGRPLCLFGTLQDVTERRLATAQLERSREELRRLSAGLNTAREEERRHFSRELHDELGQRLQAIKLELAAMLADVPAGEPARRQGLQALLRSVDVTVGATRRIAADLRPAMLDDLGLSAAIEWLVHDWSTRARLDIQLDIEPLDQALTGPAATAVYRIVQEGLTNVTRHARAHHVLVSLQRLGDELMVVVEDDGFGLAPGDTEKRNSHGLVGLRERARLFGGTAAISSPAGGGCRLEVRLPMERVDSNFSELEEQT